jgi:hypothetical protein
MKTMFAFEQAVIDDYDTRCQSHRRPGVLLLVSAILMAGCSGGEPTAGQPVTTGAANPRGGVATTGVSGVSASPARSDLKHRRDEVWLDEDGRKWFGDVPFDVFFDDPHAVATAQTPATVTVAAAEAPNSEPVFSPAENGPGASNPPGTVSDTDTSPAGADEAFSWDQLIEIQTLDDEVKSVRNFLNENLQTVGNYNSSMLMIPAKASTLAVLAAIAIEHPEKVSWKEDAVYIRDLATKMNSDTLQRGAKHQRRLLGLYEGISDTLNRSRPGDLEEPTPVESFADVAEMRLVMLRMSAAEERMRQEAGTEGAFVKNKDMVHHEAAILAALTHTVCLPGYGYEDDPKFVGYAQKVIGAAKSIVAASEGGDFSTFELSLSTISTTCQACHTDFKND